MSIKKYAQLPLDVEKAITTNAGVILSEFNPESPGTAEDVKGAILYATTGGVNCSCVATYSDWGEDIDNCPKNTKEMLNIDAWECKLSGTALTLTENAAEYQFGAADAGTGETDKELLVISPRMNVDPKDFKTLWFVCPYGTTGGFVAIKLTNALSTGGFSLQTADKGKGKFAFDYKGYSSIKEPDKVPFDFYLKKSETAAAEAVNVNMENTEE